VEVKLRERERSNAAGKGVGMAPAAVGGNVGAGGTLALLWEVVGEEEVRVEVESVCCRLKSWAESLSVGVG
jgi:hypothetical protein